MAEHVVEVTDATFQSEVLDSALPVMVDIWAPWCAPCRMVSPVLEELAAANAGTLKIAKLNVDENQRVAGELGITSIPTILSYAGGKEQTDLRMIGVQPKAVFQRVVQTLLGR